MLGFRSICHFIFCGMQGQQQRCHHRRAEPSPKHNVVVDQVATAGIFLLLWTALFQKLKLFHLWSSDVVAFLFFFLILCLVDFLNSVGFVLSFFKEVWKCASALSSKLDPLASFMCVRCLRKEKLRLASLAPAGRPSQETSCYAICNTST